MDNHHWSPLACWRWGIECARLDRRDGTVARAVGAGLWAGVPHTPMFWRGYRQYLDAADPIAFRRAAWHLLRRADGASGPAVSPTG